LSLKTNAYFCIHFDCLLIMNASHPSENNIEKVPVSPDTVTALMLRMLNGLEKMSQMVHVRGTFLSPDERQGYALAKIKGEKDSIRLYFSEYENNIRLFRQLVQGAEYIFTGYLSFYTNKGTVCFQLTPLQVEVPEDNRGRKPVFWGEETEMIKEWLCKKKQSQCVDFQRLISTCMDKRNAMVAILVRPKTETAEKDLTIALGDAAHFFHIKPYDCDFHNPQAIAQAINDADKTVADFIILSRGGGNTLYYVDDMQVLEALYNISKPLITGLGHADDHLLAEMLADHSCTTPTMVGVYLADQYKQAVEERSAVYKQPLQVDNELTERMMKESVGRYLNPVHTFYGIRWTDKKPVRWFIWILCLIGLFQIVTLFI